MSADQIDPNDPTIGDQIVDKYIEDLKAIKADPARRKKFVEDFVKNASQDSPKGEDSEQDTDDPLSDATPARPPRAAHSSSEDDDEGVGLLDDDEERARRSRTPTKPKGSEGKRRVIPKGQPIDKSEGELDPQENSEEGAIDDAERLAVVLGDAGIKKNIKYVVNNYIKNTYRSTRTAAKALNNLLKDVGAVPRLRRIVLNTYFEISNSVLDEIEQEDEAESGEDEESPRSRKGPSDNDQIVRIPLRNPKTGEVLRDEHNKPIIKEVTKEELYWATALQGGGSSKSGDNVMELLGMYKDLTSDTTARLDKFKDAELDRWKGYASRDPIKVLAENKKELIDLGIVQPRDAEKPSDGQKAVVSEIRTGMKEAFNETKDEVRPLLESLRDDFMKPIRDKILEETEDNKSTSSDNAPKGKPDAAKDIRDLDDPDEAMNVLNTAVTQELEKQKKGAKK